MSPLEPRAQELWHNIPALMFMDFWQHRNHQSDLREEGRMLGVLWTREDAEEDTATRGGKQKPTSDELRIPLSCVIEPGILDLVKQHFGSRVGINPPEWAAGKAGPQGELVEMFGSSKEEFLKFVRGFVSPKIS